MGFFYFCNADGSPLYSEYCSDIYEIGGQMPDRGKEYGPYTVNVEDFPLFNTISDVYRIFVWTSADENWCLGDIWIDGIDADGNEVIGVNADSDPATVIDTNTDDDEYCSGVRVTFDTNEWYSFADGPEASGANGQDICRFKGMLEEEGAVSLSKLSSGGEDFIDWMNDGFNWIYICVGLIGLVICCICCCAVAQKMRTKNQVIDANKPWHGGRTY